MRTETITMNVYEVGDVIKIDENCFKLTSKKHMVHGADRAMVLHRKKLAFGAFSYKLLTDTGITITLKSDEVGAEKYITHIDMSPLYENILDVKHGA